MSEKKKRTFQEVIKTEEIREEFKSILGGNYKGFLTSVENYFNQSPKIQDCEPYSIINGAKVTASLGLSLDPSLGQSFLVKTNVKKQITWSKLAQFQIGYKGLIQLGLRSNQYRSMNVSDVREDEFVSIDRLSGEIEFDWNQDQDERKKLKIIGYVAHFKLTSGFEKSSFMTEKELVEHGRTWSKTFNDKKGQWKKDFNGMAKKTVLKLLLNKYGPKTVEMQTAITSDQAVIEDFENNTLNYTDNAQKVDIEEQNAIKERQRIIDHIARSKTISMLEQVYEHIPDDEVAGLYLDKKNIINK